jgi:oleate hydratase
MTNQSVAVTPASQFDLVGGGIASLAAAALLIREGGISGSRIQIFEQLDRVGGSLDGQGSPVSGYLIRGGRMFEPHFACTFDLFRTIPNLQDPRQSVTEQIHRFNQQVETSSRCRLVRAGSRREAPAFGLSLRDRWDLIALSSRGESSLSGMRIDDYFSAEFFRSNFWCLWSTMFAFQTWHSLAEFRRYLRRFIHLLPGFNRLEGILRTVWNQYDSLILPLIDWLTDRGVQFRTGTRIERVDFHHQSNTSTVTGLHLSDGQSTSCLDIQPHDRVFITLGSMTEDSSVGGHHTPPPARHSTHSAWTLWRQIASESPEFGRPERFCSQTQQTNWVSFTVTLRNPGFLQFMENFTGNTAGTGGLVTFQDSGWCLSVVLAHQPHFLNQPADVQVFWGYGLFSDRPGDRVLKPMAECTGAEILAELAYQLRIEDQAARFFEDAICLPCLMPYITSQFQPRQPGDRPEVVPQRANNFAFLGQFCEVPEDTVFTVEYSVRTAYRAVARLLNLDLTEPEMYHGTASPGVMCRAVWTLLKNGR